MKTIDLYIIRQFLLNFIILLVVLVGMIIMIDMLIQMEKFVKEARRITQEVGGGSVVWMMLRTIADFYLPFIPLLYVFLSGLVAVAAMGFTFTAMSRSGELVALAASGISMYRVALPVLIIGAMLNSITLINQEWVIPPLAPKLMRKHNHLQNETMKQFYLYLSPDDRGRLFTGLFVPDAKDPRFENLTVLVRNDKGQTVERLSASQAFWDESRQGWELVGVNVIRWTGEEGGLEVPASTGQGAAQGVAFLDTSLSPDVLITKQRSFYARLLSMVDLREMMRNPNVNYYDVLKIMHSRLSLLIMNVLILAMGLPFFLSREPVNILKQTVAAAGVCMGAWFVGIVILQIPAAQMNPVTTAWLPVAAYVILAAWLMTRIRT